MEGQTGADETNNIQKEAAVEAANNPQSKEVSFRDLIWVKIHGSSWWPSQVVDEETVSSFNKPSKKSSGDVLVRLYGCYIYLYVNCDKCRVEFEKVLEENNGSYDEIFSKSLEEDLSRLKSGRSKRQGSKSKAANSEGKPRKNSEGTSQRGSKKKLFDSGTPKRTSSRLSDAKTKPTVVKKNSDILQQKPENASAKKRKTGAEKKLEPNTSESATTTTSAVSELKVKVMQSLGLKAPTGSPFRQNGPTSPSSDPC